jgi:diacylglycerol kinase
MALVQPESPSIELETAPPRKKRTWRDRFHVAFRGWKFGMRGQASFAVHFFFVVLVLGAAVVLKCSPVEWCVLLGCIGLVLTAELFNSALEALFRGLPDEVKSRAWPCLDISAGAVLMASLTAAIIGLIIFLSHIPSVATWLRIWPAG